MREKGLVRSVKALTYSHGTAQAREGLRLQEGGSSQNKGVAGHEEGEEMEERKGGPGEERDLASLVAQLTFRIALLNLIDVLRELREGKREGVRGGELKHVTERWKSYLSICGARKQERWEVELGEETQERCLRWKKGGLPKITSGWYVDFITFFAFSLL